MNANRHYIDDVLSVMEPGKIYTTRSICEALGIEYEIDEELLHAVRASIARNAKKGKIVRVSHGHYIKDDN